MLKKRHPDSSSKKSSTWFKPWTKNKKKLDKVSDPPPLKENKSSEIKSWEKQIPLRPFPIEKPQAVGKSLSSRKSDLPTLSTDKTSNPPVKPRSLGTKHVASQPISIPLKQSIDMLIDVMNKVKGSSSVPLKNEPSIEQAIEPNTQANIELNTPVETLPFMKAEPSEDLLQDFAQDSSENSSKDSSEDISDKFTLVPPEESSEGPFEEPFEEATPVEIAEPVILEEVEETQIIKNETEEKASLITNTLSEIRHIKIWSLESEFVDLSGKSTEDLFSEAMVLYRLGLSGESESIPQAFRLLIKVLQNDRHNLLAEAYLGSVISLMGRDAQDPNDRFKLAIQGLKILDKVVSLEPNHVEIRGLRAFVCAKLPELYFHRSDTAIEDFSYLVSRYEEDNSLFPDEFYYQILFELALAYNRLDKKKEAESTCQKLLSLTTDSKYKVLIKQEGILSSDLPSWKKQLERKSNYKNEWSKLKDEEKLQEAITLHSRAIENDLYAAEKAYEIFNQAHKHNPKDPLIKAYYADCLSLMGQSSSDTSAMFRHATHALKTLDQAVNAAPDDISIRLLRGNNSYRIPEAFFRRTFTAIRDFEYLVDRYEKDPTILPEETYWKILYDLGDAYERLEMTEDAKSCWRKLSECGDTPYKKFVDQLTYEDSQDPTLDVNQTSEELLLEGIQLHELAVTGNKKAGAKAYEVLLKAYQADMTNALAQGYLGSSMAILGQSSTDPTEMYHNFFKGIDHLRKAIADEPNNYILHLLLAHVLYRYSPSFYHGSEKAIKEFKFLKFSYERNNKLFSEEDYLQILYDLGVCYQRSGDNEKAQKCWEKLSKLTTDPKHYKLPDLEQEGEVDMDKERIRNKFKEIAQDIAQERVKEKGDRKERKHSKDRATENSTEKTAEEPRRKRKDREKGNASTPAVTETTKHRRKKHEKENSAPLPIETTRHHRKDREKEQPLTKGQERASRELSTEEKKVRREEKEKARAEKLEKAMSRVKKAKTKDESPSQNPTNPDQ